jgi:membrane carboxypeptidase/penicillin-binding protein
MWDDDPLPSKPFYSRPWFLALVILFVLALLGGAFALFYVSEEFGKKANALDLSKLSDMESASIVFDRNGQQLGKIYIQNRDTITIDDVPYDLVQALIAAEDNRFFQHRGIDYIGIVRALITNWRAGRLRQGGSTVTQQLARNSFPDVLPSNDRSIRRKLLEAFVARRIENNFSKTQILEFYFNRVYFGAGFYGVEAASRGYFGKPAKQMTLAECAMLAGMLRSPNNRSPWRNRQAGIDIRNYVLSRMLELGQITRPRYDTAVAEVPAIKKRGSIYSESYAVEFVRQQVTNLIGSDESVYGDGYRIYTTLDATLQQTAENSLKTRLEEVERRQNFEQHQTYAQYDLLYKNRRKRAENDPLPSPTYLQGALYALDNATGGVLAMVGGRDFAHNEYNRALLANRPPGTAFLPLVYATAYENGTFPGAVFQDAPIDNRFVMIGGLTGILGEWGPERADNEFEGPISAHLALVKSKVAASVRLGLATGIEPVLAMAKKAGIDSELRKFPATYLGSSEVTLEDLTLSFTMFPNGGVRPAKPFVIQRVEQKDGKLIYQNEKRPPVAVVKATTAYEVHSALAQSLERGSADKAYSQYGLKKFPLGGKTGTAYNFTDTWFVGYSSAVTCGVWAGFDAPQSIYRGAFSSEIAQPIWVDFMNATFTKFPPKEMPRPAGLKKYQICRKSGLLATDKCFDTHTDETSGEVINHSTVYSEWGTAQQAPKHNCDVHGEPSRSFVRVVTPQEGLRAELAVDLEQFKMVPMRSRTVAGEDPFGSIVNTTVLPAEPVDPNIVRDMSTPTPTPAPASAEPAVRRAEVVRPMDQAPPSQSTIKLDAPPPMEF